MTTITFNQINKHMKITELYEKSVWVREEIGTAPKYFSEYPKIIEDIFKKHGKKWEDPIPVPGYMGETALVHPPKPPESKPITFGTTKKMTEEELEKYMDECCLESSESEEEESEEEEEETGGAKGGAKVVHSVNT